MRIHTGRRPECETTRGDNGIDDSKEDLGGGGASAEIAEIQGFLTVRFNGLRFSIGVGGAGVQEHCRLEPCPEVSTLPTALKISPEELAVYRATARHRWEVEQQELARREERAGMRQDALQRC